MKLFLLVFFGQSFPSMLLDIKKEGMESLLLERLEYTCYENSWHKDTISLIIKELFPINFMGFLQNL